MPNTKSRFYARNQLGRAVRALLDYLAGTPDPGVAAALASTAAHWAFRYKDELSGGTR